MSKVDHKRKYDSVDKFSLYAAGALFTALMATNAYYSSNLKELTILSTQMVTVMGNQKELINEVGDIKTQVIRNCERSKLYWPDHKGDC